MREMTKAQFEAALARNGFEAGALGLFYYHPDAPNVGFLGVCYADGRIAYRETISRLVRDRDRAIARIAKETAWRKRVDYDNRRAKPVCPIGPASSLVFEPDGAIRDKAAGRFRRCDLCGETFRVEDLGESNNRLCLDCFDGVRDEFGKILTVLAKIADVDEPEGPES